LGIDVLVFIGKSFSATREGIFQKTSCKCVFAHYGITFWQAENKLNELKAKASRDPFSFLWYQGVKISLFHGLSPFGSRSRLFRDNGLDSRDVLANLADSRSVIQLAGGVLESEVEKLLLRGDQCLSQLSCTLRS